MKKLFFLGKLEENFINHSGGFIISFFMKPKRSIMENSVFNGHQRNPSPKNMDYSSPYYHKNLFTKNAYPFIQEFKALPDQNPAAPENEFKKRQTLDPEIPKNLPRRIRVFPEIDEDCERRAPAALRRHRHSGSADRDFPAHSH